MLFALTYIRFDGPRKNANDPKVQMLRDICQWQIFFVFFLALILKADFDSVVRSGLDALLVLAITINLIVDATLALWGRFKHAEDSTPNTNTEITKSITNPIVSGIDVASDGPDNSEAGICMLEVVPQPICCDSANDLAVGDVDHA